MSLPLSTVWLSHRACYPLQTFSRLPHVAQALDKHWGSTDFDAYLNSLLFSDRPGRQGFPEPVLAELTRLAQLHRRLFPNPETSIDDKLFAIPAVAEPVAPPPPPRAPLAGERDAAMLAVLGDRSDAYPAWIEANQPGVFQAIKQHWGKPLLDELFDSLCVVAVDSAASMPEQITRELLVLSSLHASRFPHPARTVEDRYYGPPPQETAPPHPHELVTPPPGWERDAQMLALLGTDSVDNYPGYLEQNYPHIFTRIKELWGKTDFDAYMDALCVADSHKRAGFPPLVMAELLKLLRLHQLRYPRKGGHLPWSEVVDLELRKGLGT